MNQSDSLLTNQKEKKFSDKIVKKVPKKQLTIQEENLAEIFPVSAQATRSSITPRFKLNCKQKIPKNYQGKSGIKITVFWIYLAKYFEEISSLLEIYLILFSQLS